jgi:alpha-tubulin suppressor-like RCC1 family protein
MRYLGGFITASYNPLKVPNAPTIGTVTIVSGTSASIAFTAPSNVGGAAITSYTVIVTDSSSGAQFSNTGTSSPIVVSGLTTNNTYTAKVIATNLYGPSAFSAPSGSFVPLAPALFSWGRNSNGQLGLSDTTQRNSPVQVESSTNWLQISAGNSNSAAVRTNGTLWTWGDNSRGQLGLNFSYSNQNRSSPSQVGALTNWALVSTSAGDYSCAAIKTDGTLWTWGNNLNGQLGINNTAYRSSPVQVGSDTNWSKVSFGNAFCVAIKTTGTLWAWGANGDGQLGQNNTISYSSPVQVGSLTNWSQISRARNFCLAIKTDGTLWAWGNNSQGQLGLEDRIDKSSPVQVGALTDWAQVDGNTNTSVAVRTNNTLWMWGRNSSGELGQNDTVNRSSPVQVGALTDWSRAAMGQNQCLAIKTNGTLWSWGNNVTGQLGQGNTTYLSSPVQVGSSTTWYRVSGGVSFSMATIN